MDTYPIDPPIELHTGDAIRIDAHELWGLSGREMVQLAAYRMGYDERDVRRILAAVDAEGDTGHESPTSPQSQTSQ